MRRRTISILLLVVVIITYSLPVAANDEYYKIAGEMLQINSKIMARVHYYGPQYFESAVQEVIRGTDSSWIDKYSLVAEFTGGASYLLVCSADKSRALLLDASCTPEFDWHLWQAGPIPCRIPDEAKRFCK